MPLRLDAGSPDDYNGQGGRARSARPLDEKGWHVIMQFPQSVRLVLEYIQEGTVEVQEILVLRRGDDSSSGVLKSELDLCIDTLELIWEKANDYLKAIPLTRHPGEGPKTAHYVESDSDAVRDDGAGQ